MTARKFWLIVTVAANVFVSARIWLHAVTGSEPIDTQALLLVLSWLGMNVITLLDLLTGDDHAH